MEKFNSQICTTREQSEKLLALGLKKETADMVWTHAYYSTWAATAKENPLYFHEADEDTIPAWSLHRLMLLATSNRKVMLMRYDFDIFDYLIRRIEYAIKEGYFNRSIWYETANHSRNDAAPVRLL